MDLVLPFGLALLGISGLLALLCFGIAFLLRRRIKTAAKVLNLIGGLALIGVLYLGSSFLAGDPEMSLKKKVWPVFRLAALPIFDNIAHESHSNGHHMLGLTAGIAGLNEASIEEYKLALLDSTSVDRMAVLSSMGDTYMLMNRNEEAVNCYDNMLQSRRDHQYVWNYRGMCLAKLGRFNEAVVSFDSAFFYGPEMFDTPIISDYDSARITRPNAHRAWSLAAKTLFVDKQFDRAIICFDSALTYPGDCANSWYFRGLSLSELGEDEAALSCYDSALAIATPARENWLTIKLWQERGGALYGKGLYEEAIASFDSVLSYQPDDSSTIEMKKRIENVKAESPQNTKISPE
ncbi:tetratricopeptide repeat protein [bacterium]|nr:tetratricopeptide repeat protein [bacterium]MBU1636469.1 tetratricopeptide repeat protein [bacterium]MBU1919563.1 tetratricopeptide repeat protein [bacterium]